MSLYRDIFIGDFDVALDDGKNPSIITDRAVIAQDIKHAIMESNIYLKLIGQRSQTIIDDAKQQMILIAEQDLRVVVGTGRFVERAEQLLLIIKSVDFGDIEIWL